MATSTIKNDITWEEKTTLEFLKKKNLLLSELLNEINDYYSIYDSINNTKSLEELEKVVAENSDKSSSDNNNEVEIKNTVKTENSEKVNFNDNNTTYNNKENGEVTVVPKIRLNLKKV